MSTLPSMALLRRIASAAAMRASILLILLILGAGLLAGCLGSGGPPERTLRDATGTHVDVSDLSRIAATSHDLVEILFELGHGPRVVGIPGWIDHPQGSWPEGIEPVDGVPKAMGRPHEIKVEEILTVDPSLVLLKDHPLQPTDLAAGLRKAGVPVFVFPNDETLDNIRETYGLVGRILEPVDPQAPAEATSRWESIMGRIDAVRSIVANSTTPHPVALYQLPVGFVAGKGTSADLLLDIAGAHNLAAHAGLSGYQQISREALIASDPERIVASRTAASSPAIFFSSPRYSDTTAARLGPETLRIVDPAVTALVGPRFVAGVEETAAWLHPVAFGHIDNVTVDVHSADGSTNVQASANATDLPLTYRFDAGDGSAPVDATDGSFTHSYPPGSYSARLLVIDAAGRIHEERHVIEV